MAFERRGVAAAVTASMLALAAPWPAWAGPAGADGEYFIHVVEAGDTLSTLAQRYTGRAVVWRELQALNAVADPYRLAVGKRLRIPLSRIPVDVADARVVAVVGQATIDGRALRRGMRVVEAGWLETGPDGMVTFELADRSRIALPPGSRVQVKRLRAFAGTGLGDTVLQAERGEVETAVAPDGNGVGRFEVRTPMMVTGVRGTRFEVDAGQAGQRVARSAVREGRVAVRTSGHTVMVAAGHGVAIDAGGRPSVRRLLPPPALAPLPDMPIYADSAELAWQPVSGATGYKVVVTRDAARTEALFRVIVTAPSVRLAGLPEGRLWLAVGALDRDGIAGEPVVEELTVRLNPPAPFAIAPASRATLHGTTGTFSWASVEGAAAYRFELANNERFDAPATQARVDGTTISQPLTPGQWWWRVRSLDGEGGPGPWSAPVGFTVLPEAPTLVVQPDTGGPLQVHWGTVDEHAAYAPEGYRLQLADSPDFAAPLQDVRVKDSEATLERPPGGVYYIRVARIEQTGVQSPYSPAQRVELQDPLRDGTGAPIGAKGGIVSRGR
ncbi:FecR family protein [Cupriavidus gilardii J11]|uniref:FecR family protein n=1 Tax=Cupriavidus gilardii J11 TaxID=936133 RepID=A0A562BIY8_9BURK|nr:FecR domain-containing protein [Cupriavidus gilardii]TWG84919.1 FecR family protein [Cupriavidus gilardii J11]